MRDLTLNLGGIYANTRYRKNLVGADGDATSAQLFQLPGRRLSNSAAFTGTGVDRLDSADRRVGGLRGLIYVDGRYSSEVQHRLRSRSRKGPGRLHRGQRRASACAAPTSAGRSNCGRRTCSTRTTSRWRSTRRCRARARVRGVEAGLLPALEPIVRRLPRRAAHLRPDAARRASRRPSAAPAEYRRRRRPPPAARDADLPRRQRHPRDRSAAR